MQRYRWREVQCRMETDRNGGGVGESRAWRGFGRPDEDTYEALSRHKVPRTSHVGRSAVGESHAQLERWLPTGELQTASDPLGESRSDHNDPLRKPEAQP